MGRSWLGIDGCDFFVGEITRGRLLGLHCWAAWGLNGHWQRDLGFRLLGFLLGGFLLDLHSTVAIDRLVRFLFNLLLRNLLFLSGIPDSACGVPADCDCPSLVNIGCAITISFPLALDSSKSGSSVYRVIGGSSSDNVCKSSNKSNRSSRSPTTPAPGFVDPRWPLQRMHPIPEIWGHFLLECKKVGHGSCPSSKPSPPSTFVNNWSCDGKAWYLALAPCFATAFFCFGNVSDKRACPHLKMIWSLPSKYPSNSH